MKWLLIAKVRSLTLAQKLISMSLRLKRLLSILLISVFFSLSSEGQSVKFAKNQVRIMPGSKISVDTSLQILVGKSDSLKNGKVIVEIEERQTTADQSKIMLQTTNEFSLGDFQRDTSFVYRFRFSRDSADDRQLVFKLTAKDSAGKVIDIANTDTTGLVYIKPYKSDSLTTEKDFEFWIFTGTNFDVFDGPKAEEFYFRANTLFSFNEDRRLFGQAAFYRNRYFSSDTSGVRSFVQQVPMVPPSNDSIRYAAGTYINSVKQTTDVVGARFEVLYSMSKKDDEEKRKSRFFVTAGFDISSQTVKLENDFSDFDSTVKTIVRPQRDSLRFSPLPGRRFTYRKPAYNFLTGFMWIYDSDKINVKGQLNSGLTVFSSPLFTEPTRSGSVPYVKDSKPFIQMQLFGTLKTIGVSLGFELFSRAGDIPQFNVTLSKVFDLNGILSVLQPVKSLNGM